MRTELIAVLAAAVIFIIQNAHSANISFLGVHLILPWPRPCSWPPRTCPGSPSPGRSSGASLREARAG
jgi:hypothetical protein